MLKDDWLSRVREQNNAFKSRMNSTFSLSSRAAQPDQKSLVQRYFYRSTWNVWKPTLRVWIHPRLQGATIFTDAF